MSKLQELKEFIQCDDISCTECGSQNILPYDDKNMRKIVLPRPVRRVVKYLRQTLWEKLLRREQEEIITYVSADITVFDWHGDSRLGPDLELTNEGYLCPIEMVYSNDQLVIFDEIVKR